MEKREWLKSEVEELIRTYEARPVLWDIRTKEYKSRSKKRDTLEELALKFDTTPEEITRKIHNLRNQFNSELKKIAKGQRSDDTYVSRWPHFMALTFLQATMHFRTPRGNVMILDELPLYTNERSNSDDQDYKSQSLSSNQQTGSSSFSQRSGSNPQKRRLQTTDEYQYLDNVDVLRDISSSSHKEDEFETFALSIATQMRQLPLQEALELQAEIQNLVVQKRIKVLNSMRR